MSVDKEAFLAFIKDLEEICHKHNIRILAETYHPRQPYMTAHNIETDESCVLGNVQPADFMDQDI